MSKEKIEQQVKEALAWAREVTIEADETKLYVDIRVIASRKGEMKNFIGSGVINELNALGGRYRGTAYRRDIGLYQTFLFKKQGGDEE